MFKFELMDKIKQEIVRFNAPLTEDVKDYFLNGHCYWYARMLQAHFGKRFAADLMYNPVQNHFACRIRDIYCDASGVIDAVPDDWYVWEEYLRLEPNDAARVYRDCIWFLGEEEWKKMPRSYQKTPWLF